MRAKQLRRADARNPTAGAAAWPPKTRVAAATPWKTHATSCIRIEKVLILIGFLLAAAGGALHAAEGVLDTRDSDWEKAAENRLLAAEIQSEDADILIERATALRISPAFAPTQRVQNLSSATLADSQAGDLLVKASTNYELAVTNYRRALQGYRKIKLTNKIEAITSKVNEAEAQALATCQRAAETYERAAEMSITSNPEQTALAAVAAEKAALCREKLAAIRW